MKNTPEIDIQHYLSELKKNIEYVEFFEKNESNILNQFKDTPDYFDAIRKEYEKRKLIVEKSREHLKEFKNIMSSYKTKKERKKMPSKNKIEIVLPDAVRASIPSWKGYNLIPLYAEHRTFFPDYKMPFIFETDIGEVEAWISSTMKGDNKTGHYITGVPKKLKSAEAKSVADWYKSHLNLQPGNKLVIESIEPGKRYKLEIK